jgi:hypothetical protein
MNPELTKQSGEITSLGMTAYPVQNPQQDLIAGAHPLFAEMVAQTFDDRAVERLHPGPVYYRLWMKRHFTEQIDISKARPAKEEKILHELPGDGARQFGGRSRRIPSGLHQSPFVLRETGVQDQKRGIKKKRGVRKSEKINYIRMAEQEQEFAEP